MRFRNDKRQCIKSFSFFSNNIKPREKMKRSIICKKFLDLFLMEEGKTTNSCWEQLSFSIYFKCNSKAIRQMFGATFGTMFL